MSQYKPISEWVAEGKRPVELLGYSTRFGTIITKFVTDKDGEKAVFLDTKTGRLHETFLGITVAPPERVSDEVLLGKFQSAVASEWMADCQSGDNEFSEETNKLRTQLLERMKSKRPTLGEVAREVTSAEIEWSYHEDDGNPPRDFWHVRICWRGMCTEWTKCGEQEQRTLPESVKIAAAAELRENLGETLLSMFPEDV